MKSISLQKTNDISLIDRVILYALVFGLMATSGIPFFIQRKWVLVYFVFCGLSLLYYYFQVNLQPYLISVLAFSVVLLLQLVYFGISFFIGTVGLQFIIFSTGLMAAEILKEKFIEFYVNILVAFAVISLILFVPILVKFSFSTFLISHFPISYQTEIVNPFGGVQYNSSIFFLNFPPNFDIRTRNSGPFWEPGAFGGFLVLGLMLNVFRGRSPFSKQNLILMGTIITTFSSTAYIALGIFFIGYYGVAIKSNFGRILFLVAGITGFVVLFGELDFLKKKIVDQIEDTQYQVDTRGGDSRFASAYLDIKEFGERTFYFFAGRGAHPDTRIGTLDKNTIRTNGVTDQLVRWGIPFFIFYLLSIRKSFAKICGFYSVEEKHSWLALLVLILLATSEVYFQSSFFWLLFFLHIPLQRMSAERIYHN